VRFETIKRLILEIYDTTFLSNASVPNKERIDVQQVDQPQQTNSQVNPIIPEVSLEVVVVEPPIVGTEFEVGSI
jgi:hypothetical protein